MVVEWNEKELYKRANEFCKNEDYEKALRLYRKLEMINKTDWRYSNMQGFCHMFLENYIAARECFLRAKKADGLRSTIMNNIAWSYIEEEEYEKSIEQIKSVINDYPFDPYLQINMAKSLHGLKRYYEAIPYFEKTIEMQPDFFDAYFGLALNYYRTKQYDKAAKCFQHYLTSNECVDSLYFLSKCYMYLENFVEHVKVAKKLIEIDKDDFEVLYDRAKSYIAIGSFQLAEKDLLHILSVDEEDEEARELLEYIMHRK